MGICKLGSSSANALIGDDEMVRVWGNAWVPGNWRLIDVAEGAIPHELSLKKVSDF